LVNDPIQISQTVDLRMWTENIFLGSPFDILWNSFIIFFSKHSFLGMVVSLSIIGFSFRKYLQNFWNTRISLNWEHLYRLGDGDFAAFAIGLQQSEVWPWGVCDMVVIWLILHLSRNAIVQSFSSLTLVWGTYSFNWLSLGGSSRGPAVTCGLPQKTLCHIACLWQF